MRHPSRPLVSSPLFPSSLGASVRLLGLVLGACLLASALLVDPASAQYFGRNKVQYDDFDFKTIQTDNFEVYFYPEERTAVEDASRMAERWYRRHARTFLREFDEKKPLIFYANDADFQQTNVIRGNIGQGTGGVTESLKERVVMPMTGSYAETDHVLGHELVHSFQYDIALRGDSPGFSLRRLPLWLVEGMAEYLSVGREDPHTAMWLRDALLRDDLPTIEQMTRDMYTYFPYRYGQAYMAYIGGKYGDAAVTNLYKLSGRAGLDSAFVYALGISADSLSSEWKASVREQYADGLGGRTPVDSIGQAVLGTPGDDKAFNISPVVSPDGRYVAFISRRNVFNTNLFVADARTGEIVSELEGTKSNPHFDALRFINSAGTWSPNGRRFAFVTFSDGDNEINTFDVESGEITDRIAVQGIGAIQNLAWSPDGTQIAFSGLDGGISDLYALNLETRQVKQLTNDRYADLQPTWSPSGRTIAFTTDRGSEAVPGTNFESLEWGKYRIGLYDVETKEIGVARPFEKGMHHNPQFSPDGRSLYFISDHDGFKDVYRYQIDDEEIYQVTRLQTGVSGITALSPAMSVALQNGRMLFSVFSNNGYAVVRLESEETDGTLVETPSGETTLASLLPPPRPSGGGLVDSYLSDPLSGLPPAQDFEEAEASNRLYLDRIAPPQAGASFGGPFGTQVVGGVGLFFSDMLGNQNLDVFVQANGTFKDIGGGAFYTNRGSRLNYGVGGSHIPILYGQVGFTNQGPVQILQRIFRTSVQTTASYPLSQTRRLELITGGTRFGFDFEARLFNRFGGVERVDPQELGLGAEPDPVYLGQVGLAYVGDFSNFGFTSPLQGGRYRFQVTPNVGSRQFVNFTADYRRYFFFEPVTLAFRGTHVGNYGASGGTLTDDFADIFIRETIGDPYQLAFVRGYSFNSIFGEQKCQREDVCEIDGLYGTRVAVGSVELRLPVLGTDALGLANFPYLPTELVLFTDAGIAWTSEDLSEFRFDTRVPANTSDNFSDPLPARPIVSSGVSTRVNAFGAVIMELFYARTFQRTRNWDFGVVLRPGW